MTKNIQELIPSLIYEQRIKVIELDDLIIKTKRKIKEIELDVEDQVQVDKSLKNEKQRDVVRASLLADTDYEDMELEILSLERHKRISLAEIEQAQNVMRVAELAVGRPGGDTWSH